jgi:hypothetical protein
MFSARRKLKLIAANRNAPPQIENHRRKINITAAEPENSNGEDCQSLRRLKFWVESR